MTTFKFFKKIPQHYSLIVLKHLFQASLSLAPIQSGCSSWYKTLILCKSLYYRSEEFLSPLFSVGKSFLSPISFSLLQLSSEGRSGSLCIFLRNSTREIKALRTCTDENAFINVCLNLKLFEWKQAPLSLGSQCYWEIWCHLISTLF